MNISGTNKKCNNCTEDYDKSVILGDCSLMKHSTSLSLIVEGSKEESTDKEASLCQKIIGIDAHQM